MLSVLEIKYPDSVALDLRELAEFRMFLQRMMDRRVVGFLRYGHATSRQKYLTRLKKELKAYEQHGNYEQLINIANYAALEGMAPQHLKFHFDPTVLSVTRIEE